MKKARNFRQKLIDFAFFPIRAVAIMEEDKWGLSSLRSERFEYVSNCVTGYCLDVGCGKHNLFITKYLNGKGKGIDVFAYEGLTKKNLVKDITKFPFKAKTFDTVTLIASINHIPKKKRDKELSESSRCLKHGGRIIVTMGNPIAETMVHTLIFSLDRLFGIKSIDSERGMEEGEEFYLTDQEIKDRLTKAKFTNIQKKYFWTQWGLNHLFTAEKL